MNAQTPSLYEVIDHGVDNPQYFQGCGTAFSPYTHVYTGVGEGAHDALADAIEQAAMDGWDCDNVTNDLPEETDVPEEGEDMYHYVSLRLV